MGAIWFPIEPPKRQRVYTLGETAAHVLDFPSPPPLQVGVALTGSECICCGAPLTAHFDQDRRNRGCAYAVRHSGRMA